MPNLVRALSPEGRPLHPMLPCSGRVPAIGFWLLDNGEVRLDIFVRCGANAGKYFVQHLTPASAFEFLEDYRNVWQYSGPEAALELLATFFQWEWTGGTPNLDGQPLPAAGLTLEDLGL